MSISTRLIARAEEMLLPGESIAERLGVAPRLLERWRWGEGSMSPEIFLKLAAFVAERGEGGTRPQTVRFEMAGFVARCWRCDGSEFLSAEPQAPLRLASELICAACSQRLARDELIAELGKDVVLHARARSAAAERRRR